MTSYFAAGIRKYWVFDVRDEAEAVLAIFRRGTKAFVAVRRVKGWVKFEVFGKAFRVLSREAAGLVDFELKMK